jgi:hypothetical protein
MRKAKRTNFHRQVFEAFEAFYLIPLCVWASGPTIKAELLPPMITHEPASSKEIGRPTRFVDFSYRF